MTQTHSSQAGPEGGRRFGSRRVRVLLLGTLLVIVLAGALAVWYIFFRPAGPAPIGPGAPVIPPGAVSSNAAPSQPLAVTVSPATP